MAACCRPIGLCPRAAARPRERRRAGTHGDARRRGFWGLSDERGTYLPERPSAASTAALGLATRAHQRWQEHRHLPHSECPRHSPPRARQGASVNARRLEAPRAFLCSFSHPPTLLVRGSFWAVQRRRHHQRRARSSGSAQAIEGPVDRGSIANKQQQHTRASGGFSRARVYSSCNSGGGSGSYGSCQLHHLWWQGAARSASRLTPADWAHAPRGAAGDLICSNPP